MTTTKKSLPWSLIGHRGGGGWREPENTLRAFRMGVARGATAIEIDVHQTRDGHLVVCHDPTVDRTTNGTGRIADLTLAEIRALDAGDGERIPTVTETLAFCQEADIGLVLEVKAPHIEVPVVEALREAGWRARTVVESFLESAVTEVKRVDPSVRSVLNYPAWPRTKRPGLYEKRVERLLRKARKLGVDGLSPQACNVRPYLLARAREEGYGLYVWVGNGRRDIRRALEWDLAGFITDRPEKVLAAWSACEAPTAANDPA